jgi:hypothetical protein
MRPLIVVSICLLLSNSCAPTRFVAPLPESHYAVTAAVGGPLITYSGATIPMPLSSVAVGYGYTARTSFFAGIHTTALLFKNMQLDIGSVHELVAQHAWQPGVSVSPVANFVLALRDGMFKFWPQLDLNSYWHYNSAGSLIYLGLNNWFELAGTRAHDETQPHHWIVSPQIGHVFNATDWQYITEVKYLAAGIANTPNVVEYHGISGHGTFGIYLGLTRKF